jgi:CheY-like chemotaxis protein
MRAATKSRTPEPKPAVKTSSPRARQRILLVDDDAGVRGSLHDVLVEEGYAVTAANDGQEALELIACSVIDLVLLDLNMPRKNGWDTFERLSTEHPLVPVILITARPNQLFAAVGAGVGALLEKPLDIPVLLQTIIRLLAEPNETRLARLAGRDVPFRYNAGKTDPPVGRGGSGSPPL